MPQITQSPPPINRKSLGAVTSQKASRAVYWQKMGAHRSIQPQEIAAAGSAAFFITERLLFFALYGIIKQYVQ